MLEVHRMVCKQHYKLCPARAGFEVVKRIASPFPEVRDVKVELEFR
jgi:hypothetical protein